MIFHSLDFVVFFVATLVIYWRLPHRGQNLFLVLASYVFYGYVHPWCCQGERDSCRENMLRLWWPLVTRFQSRAFRAGRGC